MLRHFNKPLTEDDLKKISNIVDRVIPDRKIKEINLRLQSQISLLSMEDKPKG